MILTVAEFRTFVDTDLTDPAVQTLLDAAEIEINEAVGPMGPITEWISSGSGPLIMLSRIPSSVTTVVADDDTLAANDYSILGQTLLRLNTGTNPDTYWRGRLAITYVPADDLARRKTAQVGLARVMLDVQTGGATTAERIGDWSETFSSSAEVAAKRDEILSELTGKSLVIL